MASPTSMTAAVATARAALEFRCRELDAWKTGAEFEAIFGELAGSEQAASSSDLDFQSNYISATDCLASGEPIYIFPPSLNEASSLPCLAGLSDFRDAEPAFVEASDPGARALRQDVLAVEPPPGLGLEPRMVWHSGDMAAFRFSAPVDIGKSSAHQVEAKPLRRRRRRCQLLLATHLKDMEGEDAACIVHVRQIHRLGFNSPDLLRDYCSKFGPVKRIAVSNAHEKLEEAPALPFPVRVRPSGIGFIVMERPEDAEAVIAQGEVQTVAGCEIKVRRFAARGGEDHQEVEEETPVSAASTTCSSSSAGCADAALSEFSVEFGLKRHHFKSDDTTVSTNIPSSANSTTDEVMSDVASLGAFSEE